MNKFRFLMPVLMAGFVFAIPRLALAICLEQGCEPPPTLSCPQSLDECQLHYGPATLIFNNRYQSSSLDFSQAFIDGDDLGDPTYIGGTDYEVCIYQGGELLTQWGAPAGPGYSFIGKDQRGIRFAFQRPPVGFKTAGPLKDIFDMKYLVATPDTHRRIETTLKEQKRLPPNGRLHSTAFTAPLLPLDPESEITAAFLNSNTCWSTTFGPEDIIVNKAATFTMKRKFLNR